MTLQNTPSGFCPVLQFRALFEALPGSCMLLQNDAPHYTILATTPEYLKQVGTTKEYLIGKGIFEAYPPNPGDPTDTGSHDVRASLELVRLHKKPHQLPVQRYDVAGADGKLSERYWRAVNKPVFSSDGEVAYIIHTAEDITEQIKAGEMQERMKGMEQAYNLFMTAPVAINILIGPELKIEFANQPSLDIWGKGKEVFGQSLLDVLPELQHQGYKELMDQIRNTGIAHQSYQQHIALVRHGKLEDVYLNWVVQPYYEEGQTVAAGVVVFATEVTEQIKIQKQLIESAQELQLAIEIAELGTFRLDLITNQATNSDKVNEWFGYTVQGYSREEGFNPIHPEDRARVDAVIENTLQSETHSRHDVVYRVVHPTNGTIRHLRSFGKTLFNEQGKPYLIIGIIEDITTHVLHKIELEESEALLQQKVLERTMALEHKNKELEQFTYAASHDMQEPLRKVATFSGFLLDKYASQLDERGKSYLVKMDASVNRMKLIIDDLLHYSHQVRAEQAFVPTELNTIVEDIKSDLDMVIEQKGAIVENEPLPVVVAVPNQLHQLLYNLITNALKFSKPDAPPQIRVSAHAVPDISLLKGNELDLNRTYVQINVSDNGIGFKQEYAEQIFSLFKRLHGRSEYEGTGIGLALCKKIAENHGGCIWAESQPGKGSTFSVLLPVE